MVDSDEKGHRKPSKFNKSFSKRQQSDLINIFRKYIPISLFRYFFKTYISIEIKKVKYYPRGARQKLISKIFWEKIPSGQKLTNKMSDNFDAILKKIDLNLTFLKC